MLAVVRAGQPSQRPSIIGRQDFFHRFGEKEREAVASFDFLDDELGSTGSSSCTTLVEDEDIVGRSARMTQT